MKKKLVFLLLTLCCSTTLYSVNAFSQNDTPPLQQRQKNVIVKQITLSEEEFDAIQNINIVWARGQVTVTQSEDETISITEKASIMPKETEVVGIAIKQDTLFIKDYNSLSNSSIDTSTNTKEFQNLLQQYYNTEYNLEVALPQKQYKEFYFKTVNANCNLENNHFDTIITETINGAVELKNMESNAIQSNTINGNITLLSDINTQQCHLTSVNGRIDASFTTIPDALFVSDTSGDIILTLPENDGFVIDKSNLKTTKNFNSSFYLKDANNKKTYKYGQTKIDIVCIDGSVTLKKLDKN